LDYSLLKNSSACKYLIDRLGLKTIFAALMKVNKKHKKGFDEDKDEGKNQMEMLT
jgi:hypothetical protein